jgi:histidinol-phosphate aminotransferase
MKTKIFNIENYVRENVKKMKAYTSARDEFSLEAELYLDANENPFENGINRYPDPYQKKLKERISEIKSVSESNIMLGNGSDEILDLIFRSFCEPRKDNVIITPPTYGMYKVLAGINDVALRNSNLNPDFTLNVSDILDKSDANTKLIVLCSPNNPTGNTMPEKQIRKLLDRSNCLVVIDEAYIDFSEQNSYLSDLSRYPNLIVCQTLSKAWGMAGIRVGICYASEAIISILNKIKPPYNMNILTQQKALRSLGDITSFNSNLKIILKEKEKLKSALEEIDFVKKIYPSDANFWLIKVDDANMRYKQLLKKSIVIRNRTNEILCGNCLRITIGTQEENEKLINVLKELQ